MGNLWVTFDSGILVQQRLKLRGSPFGPFLKVEKIELLFLVCIVVTTTYINFNFY
jgi:hypothetical protein